MKQHRRALRTSRLVGASAILSLLLLMQTSIFASSDITGILEKKGPAAKEVLAKPTITRVADMTNLPVSARQYEFFVDRPHLSMVLARLCDPSLDSYRVSVRPDGVIHVDDPAGLGGDVEVIGSSHGRRVYFISGYYDLLKIRFRGRVLLVSEYSEKKAGDGLSVDARATSYIKVDSAVAGTIARLIAFLFPKKVDGRIGRFANAVKSAAVAVHSDPVGAYNKLAASGEVAPQELKELAELLAGKTGK